MEIDKTKKIHEQISLSTWHKGFYGRTKSGFQCGTSHPELEALCTIGWLLERYRGSESVWDLETKLKKAIGLPDEITTASWNDDPKRKFHEVLNAFKKADL